MPAILEPPTNVSITPSESSGAKVIFRWNPPPQGTGAPDNIPKYYQVARYEATAIGIAGPTEIVGQSTSLFMQVPPPQKYGHRYYYTVRTVGAAGEQYASRWTPYIPVLKIRPALVPYTDPTLAAGITKIKAAHITELQTNVNLLRKGMGLEEYLFTIIHAGFTSLAGWKTHITELRTAIDGMNVQHEAWITVPVSCPTAAVIQQLRQVVAAI